MSQISWEVIREEWETSDITFKALAEKHGIAIGTLKSRRSREKWNRNTDATSKKDATIKVKKDATEKKQSRYREGTRKGVGNPNPKNQFTKRNSVAMKHGFYSKYIPEETLELMGLIENSDPADLLWGQIQIQYAAIIRAQRIMHVESKDELVKFLKKHKEGESFEEKEWEFQFAWDRHASFLNAQSRAIGELRSSIKQFNELVHEEDERRLKLEQMSTGIEKTKAEIMRLSGETVEEYEDDGFIEALGDAVAEVWDDDDNGSSAEET